MFFFNVLSALMVSTLVFNDRTYYVFCTDENNINTLNTLLESSGWDEISDFRVKFPGTTAGDISFSVSDLLKRNSVTMKIVNDNDYLVKYEIFTYSLACVYANAMLKFKRWTKMILTISSMERRSRRHNKYPRESSKKKMKTHCTNEINEQGNEDDLDGNQPSSSVQNRNDFTDEINEQANKDGFDLNQPSSSVQNPNDFTDEINELANKYGFDLNQPSYSVQNPNDFTDEINEQANKYGFDLNQPSSSVQSPNDFTDEINEQANEDDLDENQLLSSVQNPDYLKDAWEIFNSAINQFKKSSAMFTYILEALSFSKKLIPQAYLSIYSFDPNNLPGINVGNSVFFYLRRSIDITLILKDYNEEDDNSNKHNLNLFGIQFGRFFSNKLTKVLERFVDRYCIIPDVHKPESVEDDDDILTSFLHDKKRSNIAEKYRAVQHLEHHIETLVDEVTERYFKALGFVYNPTD